MSLFLFASLQWWKKYSDLLLREKYPTMEKKCLALKSILKIKHTVKIWSTIQKKLRGVITLSRAIPIKGNPDFIPSIWDGL